MRRLVPAFVLAFVFSGCGAAAPSTGPTDSPAAAVPTPSSLATATDATTSAATIEPTPTATPLPSPTYGPCPTVSPMSVATYLAANPTCFGAADVTLTGWEDVPSGFGSPEEGSRLEPTWFEEPTASILHDQVPGTCDTETCEPFLNVHVNPGSKLRFEADGVFVVITGHREDPAADACYTVWTDGSSSPAPTQRPGDSKWACVDKFVLSSVREVTPPAGALATCPTNAVLTIQQFQTTDPFCFHHRTLEIVGWSDLPPAVDFGLEVIDPAWLQGGSLGTLWGSKPIVADGNGQCSNGGDCPWMFVATSPTSGLRFGSKPGWFIVTGHIDDPVAERCVEVPNPPADTYLVHEFVRQQCRQSFVVTSLRATTAPNSTPLPS